MTNKAGEFMKKAAEALSDLNTFAIVVSVLEGGHIHAPSYKGAERIMKNCQAEQMKRLREYDAAIDKAGGGKYGVRE